MSDFKAIDLIKMYASGLLVSSYDEIRVLWHTRQINVAVDQCRASDRGAIFKQLVDEVCPYEGDPQYLISRFVSHPRGWPNVDSDVLDPLTPDEMRLVNAANVHELIGDLSEGVISCSYNEDDIRRMWRNRTLNYRVQFLKKLGGEYERFKGQMGDDYQEDGNYQDLLTCRIGDAGGWPTGWGSAAADLDPLTKEELTMIANLQQQED